MAKGTKKSSARNSRPAARKSGGATKQAAAAGRAPAAGARKGAAKAAKGAGAGTASSRRAAAKPRTSPTRAARKPASAGASPERRQKEPVSLRLKAFMPGFTVDDLTRSLRFYVDGLGFHVKERWESGGELRGVMLAAGASELAIGQDDWAKGRDRVKGVGFRVYATTTQDLDLLARRLREHGAEVDGPKEEWGSRTLHVLDPDGFKLTLSNS